MIKTVIFILTFLSYFCYGQHPCGYKDIKNKLEHKTIEDYIRDCSLEKDKRITESGYGEYFQGDTGVVAIAIKKPDEFGQIQWDMLILHEYNIYKYVHPLGTPIGWSKVSNKLVVWYDRSDKNQLSTEELSCLEKVAYPHLIKIPLQPIPPKYEIDLRPGRPILEKDGSLILYEVKKNSYSGGGSSVVVFKKDGSVSRLKTL